MYRTTRNACRLILTLTALTLAGSGVLEAQDPCAGATTLSHNSTHRSTGGGSRELFEVSTTSAGVLTLHLSGPGSAADEPNLRLLDSSCAAPSGPVTDVVVIQETPKWLALRIEASGDYYFDAKPDDPEESLGDYQIRTTFNADLSVADEEVELTSDPDDTCSNGGSSLGIDPLDDDLFITFTDDIDEWDCDVVQIRIAAPGVVVIDAAATGVVGSLYPGDPCDSSEQLFSSVSLGPGDEGLAVVRPVDHVLVVDPDGAYSGSYTARVKLYAVCDQGETDDHGDAALCATELTSSESGTIDNAQGDDFDYFIFELGSQSSVTLETTGSTDTYGVLYDEDGLRLDEDDDGGFGTNFSITKTLSAGRYFVRVEGSSGAEGSYSLDLD